MADMQTPAEVPSNAVFQFLSFCCCQCFCPHQVFAFANAEGPLIRFLQRVVGARLSAELTGNAFPVVDRQALACARRLDSDRVRETGVDAGTAIFFAAIRIEERQAEDTGLLPGLALSGPRSCGYSAADSIQCPDRHVWSSNR